MHKIIKKLGNDISTDIIYPGRYMATILPSETPEYTFGDDEEFNRALNSGKFTEGSIILAGKNFGCGSSREQAASTLKGHELIIVARSFARIFMQNAINLGLLCIECPDIEADEGDELEISESKILNRSSGKSFDFIQLPEARKAIVEAGGLIPYARKKMIAERS